MEKEKFCEVTEVKDLWLNEEVNEEDSEIQEELQKLGFLAELKTYEPVDFWKNQE